MAKGKSLMAIYNEAYDSIIAIMINPKNWKTGKKCKKPRDEIRKMYERKLASALKPVLSKINWKLQDKHKYVKIKKAIVQCNSLHPRINARLRLPWNMLKKDIPDGGTDILCLHPDRPTHILTEILLRLKPYSDSGQDSRSGKDWVGILKAHSRYQPLLDMNADKKQGEQEHLCSVEWQEEAPEPEAFSNILLEHLEDWRKANNDKAMVDLGEQYIGSSFHDVTKRVYKWFRDNPGTDNAFYLADLVVSEQLAGISAELEISDDATIDNISDFLRDCQWMLNRYVFSLILQAERSYSGEGPSYPDAYFSYQEIDTSGRIEKHYEMIENLIDLFTPYSSNGNGGNKFNKRYEGCPFNDMEFIKNLFRKIRIHFEITKGKMGKYAIGYKKHAYEVACVVAGIIDVLFYDKPNSPSIETIVRQCSQGLEGIEKRLEDAKVPFLFRQLFKGLSKEDQLFLIPQYREHFIHSFYVFALGVGLMAYAPSSVIPANLQLSRFQTRQIKEQLQKWFMVSMWHDIAYMIEKGNLVLEQHILSLMREEGRRKKGLLHWLPSLGNLMEVESLLDEIRALSMGAIEICPELREKIKGKHKQELKSQGVSERDSEQKAEEYVGRYLQKLLGDIIIAAAFERRDHGVWSALMLNHAWDSRMNSFFAEATADEDRRAIAKAIIPHHLAEWNVRQILEDYDYLEEKKVLPGICVKEETINALMTDDSLACGTKGCRRPVFVIACNGNEMGYLLGICDMISQAGRENAEMPKSISSDLGIKYEKLEICTDTKTAGSLSLHLKYENETGGLEEVVSKRFIRPALFLGLEAKQTATESIMISVGSRDNECKCFFNPLLPGGIK